MNSSTKKHFCLLPFMHLHIDSFGFAKACCVSTIKYDNIKKSSLNEIWNGEEINKLRQKFLNNEKDSRCENCYAKEASGSTSLRTETLEKYQHLIPQATQTPSPQYFDIRFSNICNLKCRTCWHGNSSKWFEDAKKIRRNVGNKSLLKAFNNNDEVRETLKPCFKDAIEFYFAGGEPLMMDEQMICLDELIANKNKKCLIRYNTNLSTLHQFNTNLLEKWSFFDQIELLISIDGLGKKGKMIRSGLDLENFNKNLRIIKSQKNISFKLAPTFSILSADLLPDLHKTYVENQTIKIDDIHFNILQQPHFYNVKSFPFIQKQKITKLYEEHISWISSKNGNTEDWKNAIQFMNSEDWSERFSKTVSETEILNELRNETFLMS